MTRAAAQQRPCPDCPPGQPRHWTHGYQHAWLHLRAGIAWTLLGWAMRAFHPNDPTKVIVARALLLVSEMERRR